MRQSEKKRGRERERERGRYRVSGKARGSVRKSAMPQKLLNAAHYS